MYIMYIKCQIKNYKISLSTVALRTVGSRELPVIIKIKKIYYTNVGNFNNAAQHTVYYSILAHSIQYIQYIGVIRLLLFSLTGVFSYYR